MMARPGSGTRPRVNRWRWRRGISGLFARRPQAGFHKGRDDRRLGRGHGPRVPDAPPRDARQPHRAAGRHRGEPCGRQPRRPTGRDRRGDDVQLWEAETGRELAHLKAGCCEDVLFHPDGREPHHRRQLGPLSLANPSRSRSWTDAIRVGPPELLRERRERWNRAAWLPDHRTLALVDNANARVVLVDSTHPHPAWSRAMTLDAGGNHRMSIGRRQPGWSLARGRRLE